MPTYWTISYHDFLVFSDTISSTPLFSDLSDTLTFTESTTNNFHFVAFSDGMSWKDVPVVGSSVHHLGFSDTLTLSDGVMKGSPQLISETMILIDSFQYAANLLLDHVVFSDTFTGVDTTGLTDTVTFTDAYSLSYHWGSYTGAIQSDSLGFMDFFSQYQNNPWIPNYPLTQWRSGNPSCVEAGP